MAFTISPSPRVRRSPYHASTVADGVVSFTTYNHMLMPTSYGDPAAEYDRLLNGVAMWDVSVERQVQLEGPDAAALAQILTPRKLTGLESGVGWYVPICDHRGVLLNDPILLMHSPEKFWLSIADGDVLLWARAIATERGLDVTITEPDVSPLAVQGPKAESVVAALLGDDIRDIRHFRFKEMMLGDIPLVVARSGWSRQGGFELYLLDGEKGDDLWQQVKAAGQPFGIGPGSPNPSERIESGLLSWGGDTDDDTNPFEVRMERYVHLDAPDNVVGIDALRNIHARGAQRHQLGVFLDSQEQLDCGDKANPFLVDDQPLGKVTATAWSPRLQKNIGLCLVDRSRQPGDRGVMVTAEGQRINAQLTSLPFI